MSNQHLNIAKAIKDDEWYTPYSTVKYIMEKVISSFEDPQELKHTTFIYPCDSPKQKSQFLEASKQYELKTVGLDEMGEMFSLTFSRDEKLFIITNPPFSKLKEFLGSYKMFKTRYPNTELVFISPLVMSNTLFANYYCELNFYPLPDNTYIHNGKPEKAPSMLCSSIELPITITVNFSFDENFILFKDTNAAIAACKYGLTKDYFYTSRGAIPKQSIFRMFGYEIDFENKFNCPDIPESLKFGMIKWKKVN